MASENNATSWHPALMPSGFPDSPALDVLETIPPTTVEEALNDDPIPHDAAHITESQDLLGTEEAHESGDALIPSPDDGGASAFNGEGPPVEDVEESHLPVSENEIENGTPAPETQPDVSASADPHPTRKHAAKHSSSLSFARTVSHEISLSDDDDADWSLPRTDTDPFNFMAQSEKTNSFPVVPLISGSDAEYHHDAPLQLNQALDVLEEAERDLDVEEEEYQTGAPSEDALESVGAPKHYHAHSRSIGGDVELSEVIPAEARFEEGVPLIPHNGDSFDHQEDNATTENTLAASFGNDDEDNDGFFGQFSAAANDATDEEGGVPSLQRKSTMQVLSSIDSAPPSRQESMNVAAELDTWRVETIAEETTADASGMADLTDSPIKDDLASKWQEAFADGNDAVDFLLDDSSNEKKDDFDAAAFLGSDDEGLLDDEEPLSTSVPAPAMVPKSTSAYQPQAASAANSYVLVQQHQQPQQQTPSQFSVPPQAAQNPYSAFGQAPPPAATPQFSHVPTPQLEPPKAQSFADKSRGGYSSPYDLPTNLITNTVKPRKRSSTQQFPHESLAHAPPPPKTAAVNAAPPKPPVSAPRAQESFFEELPVTSKLRPSSRQNLRAPSPGTYAPPGPSPLSHPHSAQPPPHASPISAAVETSAPSVIPNLVGPERINTYTTPPTSHPSAQLPGGSASRYSPAPAQVASAPPVVTSRYSPAPAALGSRPSSSYTGSHAIPPATAQPSGLPHLPRTSSPLAHFEMTSEITHATSYGSASHVAHHDRGSTSPHEMRLTRVPSLPTTREVEEEEDLTPGPSKDNLLQSPPPPPAISRYSPLPAVATRRTPPPPAAAAQSMVSPPRRPGSSYAPHAPSTAQAGFVPPPRAQTQSPGATRNGKHASKISDPGRLPNSLLSSVLPMTSQPPAAVHAPSRPSALPVNMIAPTDGREHDPLQRWQGVPIISWGVGGTIITSFPKSIPRYVMNQTTPMMLRAAGEVKVRNIKDIEPLPERLAKFPGPLKGKSKKKEVLAWLSAGIDTQEKEVANTPFQAPITTEAKRASERLLLWKILHVFIEYDGVLEGSPAVEKAVRGILSPETAEQKERDGIMFPSNAGGGVLSPAATSMQSDGVDAGTIEQIRGDLLKGDHETAVWAAVDKRHWGHAMLISHTLSLELYKRVAQEFVRKEVNHMGHNNESLAALYKILSGNYDDCVDELIPVHARAGLQLVSTESSMVSATGAVDGLDKWQETLTLVLSNRSADDVRGLHALGKLLSSYGRHEAAHICFIFSRSVSTFGGMDDPNVDYVLVGSDHRQPDLQLAQDAEALQLSEVYEYGLSQSGAPSFAGGAPHLSVYKLHHVIALAEYGHRDKALQYCDTIVSAISAQTRRSPYHHPMLEAAVVDIMSRLKQAPKEESSSWMSKPSMNKVSDSMWNRFNKFVAGDEQDGNGGANEGDNGPFGRITTPTLSRSPSVNNFESFGVASPPYVTSGPVASSASRYAPQAASSSYFPPTHPQTSRNPNEYIPSSYEPSYPGAGSPSTTSGGFAPSGIASGFGYQSLDAGVNLATGNDAHANAGQYQPLAPKQADDHHEGISASSRAYQPEPISYGGYQPAPINATSTDPETHEKGTGGASGGYEPPSLQPYGYEPPSYEPGPDTSGGNDEDGDEASKPKKKSFMDDDEDDVPMAKSQDKSRADRDRENDEMFRKAAEEDAKRAAAQQANKKSWSFSGWFGGGKKEAISANEPTPGKPIKAKLGEASSFVYDPDLKRWINKKAGAENVEAKAATPPPPKGLGGTRSFSGTPPARTFTPPPPSGRASVPPNTSSSVPGLLSPPTLTRAPSASQESIGSAGAGAGAAPPMMRSVSGASTNGVASRPPSRPMTSVSNASSIDDLLGTAGPRKAGQKKPRKTGRYVDVMAK